MSAARMDTPAPQGEGTALGWARFYLSRGWSVVPVRPGEKLPAVAWAEYQDAPADAARIEDWFGTGGYGCGLVQGARAGTVILDFDGEEGHATLAELERAGAVPADAPRQLTPGGGVHVMVAHPGQPVPTRKKVLAGMDVRGDGGFIVAAPSLHASGRRYAWDVDAHPEDVAVPPCPPALAALICGEAPLSGEAGGEVVRVERASSLGLTVTRVEDGREAYMRDTILAVAGDLRVRLGRLPTQGELVEEAWPQYAARVDFTRPGRGRAEFEAKAAYTLARAARGAIRGFEGVAGGIVPAAGGPPLAAGADALLPAAEARRSRFTSLSLDELMALPPPEWLVRDLLVRGGYAVLYGPPKTYKTFVALALALGVAYAEPVFGREVAPGGVLYVAGEGVGGLGKRVRAWQARHGLEGVDAPFRVIPGGVNLMDPAHTADLILAAVEATTAEAAPVVLVVLDTVARAIPGADENSAQDVGRFNEAVAEIIRQVPGAPAVLGLHHTGKDEGRGARGSNALLGAVDTMLRLKREEDRITLEVEAQKDGEEGPPMRLRVHKVLLGAGLSGSSLVVASDDHPPETEDNADQVAYLLKVAGVIGRPGRIRARALFEALGVAPNGRAFEDLAAAIPMDPGAVDVRAPDGGLIRLRRERAGDGAQAPIEVVRTDCDSVTSQNERSEQ